MGIQKNTLEPLTILDRIISVYGFTQKLQLANHFEMSPSSLQNRYTRGTISYDLAAFCSLETGASLRWILTGEGPQFEGSPSITDPKNMDLYTLNNGILDKNSILSIDSNILNKQISKGIAVRAEGKLHFVDQEAPHSDGLWLVDIESANSIRELTILPGRRLHVAGGKVPFECNFDDIRLLGRVVGIYSEIN
ncbi:phage repressor protein CI [Erwinia tasmaniensis]|uniref:Bacteriophage 186 repressor protein CI n=1 Tax=Erwinia tasmaniensis (strain DSM 17950 / CFBP 7177 / CIP 109463 / NCPPB 4357 / Et1/99) TaxID=465817 RepID=B2VHB8_ERWT9|nr:phage repressor protein CI [Erwinia tasmaniensis]CAO95600.1 Bacteriophage 186 repressor protein CI [Erwinia tasmaniensis Et1/99]